MSLTIAEKKQLLSLLEQREVIRARKDMAIAASLILPQSLMPEFEMQWFHRVMCKEFNDLVFGSSKKVMNFIPPQNGKSTIGTEFLAAFSLGVNPNTRIAIASYSSTMAQKFIRNIKVIMTSEIYKKVFPNTRLKEKGIKEQKDGVNNADYFEVVGARGYVMGVGVQGALTGNPVDLLIFDDPFRDRNEAESKTMRESVWSWWMSAAEMRLTATSKVAMTFTRWTEDDPAGRILNPNSKYYDKEEASQYRVIAIQGLKEAKKSLDCAIDVDDPREVGESLWEEKHPRKKYERISRIEPRIFNALIQQRPTSEAGNIFNKDHFNIVNERELPFNVNEITPHFIIDGAYTDNSKNDETAIATVYYHIPNGQLYVLNVDSFHKTLDQFLDYFQGYATSMNRKGDSAVYIEPKASGKSMVSMLKKFQYGLFNTIEIPNKIVALGKETRANSCTPITASGRVNLVQGAWNAKTIDQLTSFPRSPHDDIVDVITYAIYIYCIGLNQQKYSYQ